MNKIEEEDVETGEDGLLKRKTKHHLLHIDPTAKSRSTVTIKVLITAENVRTFTKGQLIKKKGGIIKPEKGYM